MVQGKSVAAVVVAGGSSSRMGFDKLFYTINGVEVLRLSVQKMAENPAVDSLVVVAGDNMARVQALFRAHPPAKPLQIVRGGATRAHSVAAGARAAVADIIAVHDAARPFVPQDVISRTLAAAAKSGAAAPGVPVKDTIKQQKNGFVAATPPRRLLLAVQTPQAFHRGAYLQALAAVPLAEYPLVTDDCMVMERAGKPVQLVEGAAENIKITTPEDLPKQEETMQLRIGHGYDVHKLVEGRPLILGGVHIPFALGLLGHSDADVLLHVVCDALLGAAALGDIGRHFPDTDPAYAGADSLVLLQRVAALLAKAGFAPVNLDATLLCQAPKLAPHIPAMRQNIADALQISPQAVSVKATTEEGLGFTGAGQGIAAHCVACIRGPGV